MKNVGFIFSFQDRNFLHIFRQVQIYTHLCFRYTFFSDILTPSKTFFFYLQQLRTVLSCTNLVEGSAVFTQSTQMVQASLMYIVTKLQPAGDGQ